MTHGTIYKALVTTAATLGITAIVGAATLINNTPDYTSIYHRLVPNATATGDENLERALHPKTFEDRQFADGLLPLLDAAERYRNTSPGAYKELRGVVAGFVEGGVASPRR
ncbi:hypothetical protein HZB01_01055 [Candidatus Woesearchaeota archaeon]|nr:hypothetical protein [Candidatus Woesearchaeota archaeon]